MSNIGVYVFPCESEAQAHADEIQQIAQLRREGYVLANMCDGGEGQSGLVKSAATRAKLSAAQAGKKRKPLSATHKANIGLASVGRKHSLASSVKMSAAQTGNKKWLGKKHSAETRIKMSLAATALWKGRKNG